jgi:hypothetical protein
MLETFEKRLSKHRSQTRTATYLVDPIHAVASPIVIVITNQDSTSSKLLSGSSYSCCIRNLHALVHKQCHPMLGQFNFSYSHLTVAKTQSALKDCLAPSSDTTQTLKHELMKICTDPYMRMVPHEEL